MEDEPRLSSRTSVQMMNFIEKYMLNDDSELKTVEQQIPVPVGNEWDAVIEQMGNKNEILQELVRDVNEKQTKQLEEVVPEKSVEVLKNRQENIFPITIETRADIVIEKQEILRVEEVRKNQKTIKKRLLGFFRRSGFRIKKKQ